LELPQNSPQKHSSSNVAETCGRRNNEKEETGMITMFSWGMFSWGMQVLINFLPAVQ